MPRPKPYGSRHANWPITLKKSLHASREHTTAFCGSCWTIFLSLYFIFASTTAEQSCRRPRRPAAPVGLQGRHITDRLLRCCPLHSYFWLKPGLPGAYGARGEAGRARLSASGAVGEDTAAGDPRYTRGIPACARHLCWFKCINRHAMPRFQVWSSMPASSELRQRSSVVARLSGAPMDDEARLRQLGYKQELTRELSLLKNVRNMCFCCGGS